MGLIDQYRQQRRGQAFQQPQQPGLGVSDLPYGPTRKAAQPSVMRFLNSMLPEDQGEITRRLILRIKDKADPREVNEALDDIISGMLREAESKSTRDAKRVETEQAARERQSFATGVSGVSDRLLAAQGRTSAGDLASQPITMGGGGGQLSIDPFAGTQQPAAAAAAPAPAAAPTRLPEPTGPSRAELYLKRRRSERGRGTELFGKPGGVGVHEISAGVYEVPQYKGPGEHEYRGTPTGMQSPGEYARARKYMNDRSSLIARARKGEITQEEANVEGAKLGITRIDVGRLRAREQGRAGKLATTPKEAPGKAKTATGKPTAAPKRPIQLKNIRSLGFAPISEKDFKTLRKELKFAGEGAGIADLMERALDNWREGSPVEATPANLAAYVRFYNKDAQKAWDAMRAHHWDMKKLKESSAKG